ncbi:MAG: tetratricopeptide repeat protein [Planctomycetales bacterium]|nr:tetratricopeptide repeat protein [Planctomycetales bacterium]
MASQYFRATAARRRRSTRSRCSATRSLQDLLRVGLVAVVGLSSSWWNCATLAAPFKTGDEIADSVLPQEEDTNSKPEIKEAAQKLQNKDFEGAMESLRAASEKYPDLGPAEVMMASIFLRSNAPTAAQQAHALLDQAVIDNPDDPEAYLLLGGLALQNSLMTESGLLFDKADALIANFQGDSVRLDRFHKQSLSGRAQVAERKRDWKTAEPLLRKLAELDDANAATHQRLGRTLFMLGTPANREESYKQYARAAELNEQAQKAEVAMGMLYANDDGDTSKKKATEWFDYAVKQHPEHVPTRIAMVNYLVSVGDIEGALTHAQEAARLDPESSEARLTLGQVYRFLGRYAEAQELFEAAYRDSPTNFATTNWLTLTLADQDEPDKHERARELIEMVLQQMAPSHPSRAEAVATAGWVYHQLGQDDKAEQGLTTAINSGRVGPDAVYHLAKVYADKGDKAQAKVYLEMALKNDSVFTYRRQAEQLLAELQ